MASVGSIAFAREGQIVWSAVAFVTFCSSALGATSFARDRSDRADSDVPAVDPEAVSIWQAWRRLDDRGSSLYMAHSLSFRGQFAMAAGIIPSILTGGFTLLWAVTGEYVAATWTLLAGLWITRAGLRHAWHWANQAILGRRVPAPRARWSISIIFAVGATAFLTWFLVLSQASDQGGEAVAVAISLAVCVAYVVHLLLRRRGAFTAGTAEGTSG